jgi:hypothetical protein
MNQLQESGAGTHIRKVYNLIGPQVRRLRCAKNWSQEKLQLQLQDQGLNIWRQRIARIESGAACVSDFEVVVFSRALDVVALELLPKIEDKHQPAFAALIKLLSGKARVLMPPEEILMEHSRPLLLMGDTNQSETDQ